MNSKTKYKGTLNWERWSYDVIYLPILFVWLYYGIKAWAFWFFSPVNPTLIFAGFEGGSKKEIYDQLPKWVYPTTLLIDPTEDFGLVQKQMLQVNLNFPVAVKPDSGMGGVLFRVIKNEKDLKHYNDIVGENYIIQRFIDSVLEFSVFHIRYPDEKHGFITGLIVKDLLHVVGNGSNTLGELVALLSITKNKLDEMFNKHKENWNEVIPLNEKYFLSLAGNHDKGAKFNNLNHEIDQELCEVFDNISIEAGHFYFGRYDLKCTSLEDLKLGKNINILEYNGAGAAITHIFDRNMSYIDALKEIVRHWRYLYKIGNINYKKGVPYWSFIKGFRFMQKTKRNFKRLVAIDKTLVSI